MSGFRGTFGSPKDDKVVAWIYDHIEPMDAKIRNRVIKLIQKMINDRHHLLSIKDEKFRVRVAKLVRTETDEHIWRVVKLVITQKEPTEISIGWPEEEKARSLETRLMNLATRNYRMIVRSETKNKE